MICLLIRFCFLQILLSLRTVFLNICDLSSSTFVQPIVGECTMADNDYIELGFNEEIVEFLESDDSNNRTDRQGEVGSVMMDLQHERHNVGLEQQEVVDIAGHPLENQNEPDKCILCKKKNRRTHVCFM